MTYYKCPCCSKFFDEDELSEMELPDSIQELIKISGEYLGFNTIFIDSDKVIQLYFNDEFEYFTEDVKIEFEKAIEHLPFTVIAHDKYWHSVLDKGFLRLYLVDSNSRIQLKKYQIENILKKIHQGRKLTEWETGIAKILSLS